MLRLLADSAVGDATAARQGDADAVYVFKLLPVISLQPREMMDIVL